MQATGPGDGGVVQRRTPQDVVEPGDCLLAAGMVVRGWLDGERVDRSQALRVFAKMTAGAFSRSPIVSNRGATMIAAWPRGPS